MSRTAAVSRAGRTFAAAAVAGAVGVAGCGSAALQTTRPPRNIVPSAVTVIFDCAGHGQVRPTSLTLFCADAGEIVTDLRWFHWGTNAAQGAGTLVLNPCTPDCAAGHTRREPVDLFAHGLSLSGTSATYTELVLATAGDAVQPRQSFSLTPDGPVAR